MRLKKKLIPRKVLNGRKYTQTFDSYNYPTETFEAFKLTDCGVQPITGQTQELVPEGFRDKKLYKVFTETEVLPRTEGSNIRYQVEVRTGLWCDVVDVQIWDYGIQSHYMAIVAEPNER